MTRQPGIRLDVWLHRTRFFRTRRLAAEAIRAGIRVNGSLTTRSSLLVRCDDQLTFVVRENVRAVRILGLPKRRVAPAIAREAFTDLRQFQ